MDTYAKPVPPKRRYLELEQKRRSLCALLALQITGGHDGTEFSGVWLTGALLSMEDIGSSLFIIAVVLTFVFLRVAAVIGLASSVFCLPLYLCLVAPVPFAQIFARGHEFKIQSAPGFRWHRWPVTGALVLAVTLYVCIRRLVLLTGSKCHSRVGPYCCENRLSIDWIGRADVKAPGNARRAQPPDLRIYCLVTAAVKIQVGRGSVFLHLCIPSSFLKSGLTSDLRLISRRRVGAVSQWWNSQKGAEWMYFFTRLLLFFPLAQRRHAHWDHQGT
jgi:hypothetical protein